MERDGGSLRKSKSDSCVNRSEKLSSLSLPRFRSPHTMLKDTETFSSADCCACELSKESIKRQSGLSEQYLRRLKEAEQSLSSRDVLISMLQEQLGKLEQLYKKHLDEYQDLRFKYCSTVQELSNLKKICEKLEQENRTLSLNKCSSENTEPEISKLKEEAEKWKSQFEDLSKRTEKIIDKKETTVDGDKDRNYLIEQYDHIDEALATQNAKLDVVIDKLDDLKSGEEVERQPEKKMDEKNASTQTETDKTAEMMQALQLEVEKLNKQNDKLEIEIQVNEEIQSDKLLEQESVMDVVSKETQHSHEFLLARDSILNIYKKENEELRELLEEAAKELEKVLQSDNQRDNSSATRTKKRCFNFKHTIGKAIENALAKKQVEAAQSSDTHQEDAIEKFDDKEIQTEDDIENDTQKEEEQENNEVLERKLAETIKELNALKEESNLAKILQAQYESLRTENEILNNELTKTLEILQNYKSPPEQQKSEENVSDTQTLIENLQNELMREKVYAEESQKLLERNQRALNEMQNEYYELKSLTEALQGELQSLRNSKQSPCENVEKINNEIEKLRFENKVKDDELSKTKSKLNKLEIELSETNILHDKEKQEAERQIMEFKGIYFDFERKMYKEHKNLKRELEEKDEQIKLLTKENEKLQKQLSGSKKQVEDKRISTEDYKTYSGRVNEEPNNNNDMQYFVETILQENNDLRNILDKLVNNLDLKLNDLINNRNQIDKPLSVKEENNANEALHLQQESGKCSSISLPDLSYEKPNENNSTTKPKTFDTNIEIIYSPQKPSQTESNSKLQRTPSFDTIIKPEKCKARIHISTQTTYRKINDTDRAKSKIHTHRNFQEGTIDGRRIFNLMNMKENRGPETHCIYTNVHAQLKDVHEQLAVTNKLEQEINELQKELCLQHSQMISQIANSRDDIRRRLSINMKDSKGQLLNELLLVQSTLLETSNKERQLLQDCKKLKRELSKPGEIARPKSK